MKRITPQQKSRQTGNGYALISALLVLFLLSALAAGLIYKVNTEQNLQRTDSGNNLAWYGAEAAMEKIAVDLNTLYGKKAAPTWCDIQNVVVASNQPAFSDVGVNYTEYTITIPNPPSPCTAAPPSSASTITQGANAGLIAQVVPMKFQVTAQRPSGETVRMFRQVNLVEIPVFQFGAFSSTDLSFFPGPNFDFNGRIHTNGNLFLSAGSGSSLTFHTAIRAAGDVVRDTLANGGSVSGQGRTGNVLIPTTTSPTACTAGQTTPSSTCRDLGADSTNTTDEGSAFGGPTPANDTSGIPPGTVNPNWPTISQTNYNSLIESGTTGAKVLTMAFVKTGVQPIEIIRRPLASESPNSAVGQSRLYNLAQIRVLLSDDPGELPGGASDANNIRLANVKTNSSAPDYSNGVPIGGLTGNTYFAEATTASSGVGGETGWTTSTTPAGIPSSVQTLVVNGSKTTPMISTGTPKTWNLLDGYLRVEYRNASGNYVPVTQEWLQLGFARGLTAPTLSSSNPVHPKAILILQQEADRNGVGSVSCGSSGVLVKDSGTGSCFTGAATRNNWYPINFYEVREGELRENQRTTTSCAVGGAMNIVEVDVGNLKKWLNGTIGTSGTNVESTSQNGYILYFSDRRGMLPNPNATPANSKNGEYGFEDVINPASAAGTPNGTLDSGEDVDGNNLLDAWGANNLGYGFGLTGSSAASVTTNVNCLNTARKNFISGARHAVRLVDAATTASATNLPTPGFTLASENPAYVQGDFNASSLPSSSPVAFTGTHASSAVIADTVTLLSNSWTDLESFSSPADCTGRPAAATTYYRVAIATGKNMNFPQPTWSGSPAVPQDYGTDGGVHNFLRYLEDWSSSNSNYMGSMASLFYENYGTGVYKCCGTVYNPPTRNYAFDTDFLTISKMPPGTPKFEDVDSLGFQQIFQ